MKVPLMLSASGDSRPRTVARESQADHRDQQADAVHDRQEEELVVHLGAAAPPEVQ